ncbi:MAG: transcriptional repressor [Bacteroidales bacterium]|nr:transcriptional repressor [Bacteroidales bacterium]
MRSIIVLDNHPTAEQIIGYIHKESPSISTGTVYNVLDTMEAHSLIRKVKTEKGIMRYEAIKERHHHLYCTECDFIEDYTNQELDLLIESYFKNNTIDNFVIDNITLQINGKFIKHKSNTANK